MKDKDRFISRRSLLYRAVGFGIGVLATLGMNTIAVAKMAQKAAGYQDKPHDDQKCSGCALFKPPSSCTLVDGTISPDGWCRFYSKKAS